MLSGGVPAISADFFGLEYTEPETDPIAPSNLPYNIIRINTNGSDWGAVSTSDGVFNTWTTFDDVVSRHRTAGKKIHYVVGNQNAGTPTPPAYVNSGNLVTKYGAWIDALLSHAGTSLDYVTVWNEPDSASLVTSTSVLITLAQTLFNKVQTYNTANGTSIKVMGPSVSGADDGSSRLAMLQAFFSGGGGAYIDIVDFHGYVSGVFPERLIDLILNVRTARDKAGLQAKPIWITEDGLSSVSTPTQSDRVTYRAMMFAWASALGVQLVSNFAYNFSPYNLWTSGGGLNAEGNAHITMALWLTGASPAGWYRSSDVCYADFTRPGGYRARLIRTTDRSTPSYTLPSWATQKRDLVAGTKTTGISGTVTLGFNPLLLESGDGF